MKDDGLAAGKGVVVTDDRDLALAHAEACGRVVVEEYLDGPEVSLFALCSHDGTAVTTVHPLQPAQDFKRIFDGDRGAEHRWHGRLHPAAVGARRVSSTRSSKRVLQPTVDEMARRGVPFSGLLYAGLALTSRGVRVIEFNVRFGDPETQPLLALLDSPLGALLKAAADGNLDDVAPPRWKPGAAVAVVMASAGYPESSRSGDRSPASRQAEASGCDVLHAGTALADGGLVTAGGRVLAVTAVGGDVAAARERAYAGVRAIDFPGRSTAPTSRRGRPVRRLTVHLGSPGVRPRRPCRSATGAWRQ